MRAACTAAVLLLAAAGCAGRGDVEPDGTRDSGQVGEGVATGVSVTDAGFVGVAGGLPGPESVRYDPEQDAYFVSCMTGFGSAKDGNGMIVRLDARDLSRRVLAEGGKAGATLHAPKGMAIHGDTLWVADIDVLRGFHRVSGAPLASIDFAAHGAVLLNDVALAPDGTLRITDTGIIMSPKGVIIREPGRIYTLGPGGAVKAGATPLAQPNGIAWDAGREQWVVVSFDPFVGRISSMTPDGLAADTLHRTVARIDGVEVLPGGGILYTTWGDSTLHLLADGRDVAVVRQVPEPADIGIDTRRGRVAIPLSTLGAVQLWSLGRAWTGDVRPGRSLEPSNAPQSGNAPVRTP